MKEERIRAPSTPQAPWDCSVLTATPAGGCHGSHISAEEAKIREVKELAPITQHAAGK